MGLFGSIANATGLDNLPGVNTITGYGDQALSGVGLGPAPNAWDAEANTKPVMNNAQGTYDKASAWAEDARLNGPQYQAIKEQQIRAPATINAQNVTAPNAINAERIGAPSGISVNDVGVSDLVGGQQASDLRNLQLRQAETAANSPSSAAAQMRAAGAQIQGQQAAMAAQARGQNRAAARRDAMLATGNLGMQAANQTAALAAQEQAAKQQAYSQSLAGVRAGDVNAANIQANVGMGNQQANLAAQSTTNAQALAAAQANQQAGLQAQTTTGAQSLAAQQANQAANLNAQQYTALNRLDAAKANQQMNLQAQQYTANNAINAWNNQQQAANAYLGAANQATGQQNQANATWANYASGQNEMQQKQNAGLASFATSAVELGSHSDTRAKEDVARFGEPSLAGAAQMLGIGKGRQPDNDGATTNPIEQLRAMGYFNRGGGRETGGGAGGFARAPMAAPVGASASPDPWGQHDFSRALSIDQLQGMAPQLGGSPWMSDEETKQAVAQMGDDDLIDWANKTDLATYRYKPGVADGGATPQVGVSSAQRLERTGPLGRLMVSEGPDGLKRVDYPKLAYAVGKAAMAKANQNEDLYGQLLRDVQIANQRNNRKGA